MQTVLLMVALLYPGEGEREIAAKRSNQEMPTLQACWDAAHALVEADISGAEELIGVEAGCAVIGKATEAKDQP